MLWWTLRQLKSKDYKVRRDAVKKLGNSGNPKVVEPLITMLNDANSDVRIEAIEALGKFGDKGTVEPLIATMLKDSSGLVTRKAIEVLGIIGDASAVKPLIATLSHKNKYHRQVTVEALGKIGDKQAAESLAIILNDSESEVRYKAAAALKNLGYEPENKTQKGIMFVALEQWDSAIKLGADSIEPLILALSDSSVRTKAAEALGKIGNPRAINPLIEACDSPDEDFFAEALISIGTPEAKKAAQQIQTQKVQRIKAKYKASRSSERQQQIKPRSRGALVEPYCSSACYDKAGEEMFFARMQNTSGPCAFCQTQVFVGDASDSVKILPYRMGWIFACCDCNTDLKIFIREIRECCQCGISFTKM